MMKSSSEQLPSLVPLPTAVAYEHTRGVPFYSSKSVTSLCETHINLSEERSPLLASKFTYYFLSSVLTIGVLMLILIPLGSTFLYIDYRQQLAQRKSNKNDLCSSKCFYGAECLVDEYTNQPFCRCPLSCPDDYQPVCGSDSITYANQCHLKYESCNKQQVIEVVANSTCDASFCSNVTCHRYQRCQVDEHGQARCVCSAPSTCPSAPHLQPVCASNGKLFSSKCEMERHACFYNLNIVTTDLSLCLSSGTKSAGERSDQIGEIEPVRSPSENGCGEQNCPPYAQCQSDVDGAMCKCPEQCSPADANGPVCATNNQTYANECEMQGDACRRQVELRVLHPGQCGRCHKECRFYSECKLNELNIPECICPQVCLRVDRPVCGDNGVTYENECGLRMAACRMMKQISVQFNGSCDLCHNVVCHYGATCLDGQCVCTDNCSNSQSEPLCANDGNTYRNECEMNRVACNSRKELIALFYGKCEETSDSVDEAFSSALQDEDNRVAELPTQRCYYQMAESCAHHNQIQDEPYVYICENQVFVSKCEMLRYGCTSTDDQNRCTQYCQCNQYGSELTSGRHLCSPQSGQCYCKQGVSGTRCDQCAPGFWNFAELIEDHNAKGCKPCNCNKLGSLSNECDQSTGQCLCKPTVSGIGCNQCPKGSHLHPRGCVHSSILAQMSGQCLSTRCNHGAKCRDYRGYYQCTCQFNCKNHLSLRPVCSSDGSKHQSMCHFREYMCLLQKKLHTLPC